MISEEKKRIVIGNYFNVDCDVDTTIREAYELGFDRGIQKAAPVVRRDVLKQILEIISDVKQDANNGYMFDMVDEIEKRIAALKGGEQE